MERTALDRRGPIFCLTLDSPKEKPKHVAFSPHRIFHLAGHQRHPLVPRLPSTNLKDIEGNAVNTTDLTKEGPNAFCLGYVVQPMQA